MKANPITSASQYGLAQAVASGTARGRLSMTPAVAREMIAKTPKAARERFASQLAKRRNPKHAEVLSGATFHRANTERGAKTQAAVYAGSGHRTKVAQHGGKWGCWVWPKAKNKKRNPEAGAVAMREAFTGLPADSTVVVSRDEHVHGHLAALGPLVELRGKTVKGENFAIEFARTSNPRRKAQDIVSKAGAKTKGWLGRRAKAVSGLVKGFSNTWINPKKMNPNGPVLLCSNESGSHLFIEGGDQSIDLGKVGLGDQAKKETAIVGAVWYIVYHARKKFDGKEEEYDYEHEFSEESGGPRPMLRYDVKNKHLYLDGGVYHIPKPLFGGASQGITD